MRPKTQIVYSLSVAAELAQMAGANLKRLAASGEVPGVSIYKGRPYFEREAFKAWASARFREDALLTGALCAIGGHRSGAPSPTLLPVPGQNRDASRF